MNAKKSKGKTPPIEKPAKQEHPLFRYNPFPLPGDAVETPRSPLEFAVLHEDLKTWLDLIASPHGVTPKEQQREKMFGASMAAMELIKWLFDHAHHGDKGAQEEIATLAKILTQEFVYHALKKSPGILPSVKRWAEMPGWLSRAPEIQEEMQKLCIELDLGGHYPFPLSAKETARGNVHSIRTAQNELVDRLHGYIEQYRISAGRPITQLDRYFIHPLVLEMVNLQPLSPDTVKDWIAVSRKVLKDATAGNPAMHAAFIKGGKYSNLGMPPTESKRAEIRLWKPLRVAWRHRAKKMARLPKDAPLRK